MVTITLTDYQIEALNNAAKVMGAFVEEFQKAINDMIKNIKPILDQIRDVIYGRSIIKIKYKPVKIIGFISHIIVNKPYIIHCRNNC
jgi:hypothetical protein